GPVRKIAAASQTGHATNIISGLAQGLQATALPAVVLVLGILSSWHIAGGGAEGIYGIGVAVMGQLSLTGLIVALDAFGPITDNAGGIAEMADLPEDVRNVTNPAVLIGLLLGGLMVCLFAALSMEAVGRAGGEVVEEVRRQFREKPGIMEGTEQPDYATCVDLVTKAAQREMILPAMIPIFIPFLVGVIDIKALGGLLI